MQSKEELGVLYLRQRPTGVSHGSLLDTARKFICMLWNRYHASIYNCFKVFSIMSRHMLSAWLSWGTVTEDIGGFDWPLAVVVSWYQLTQTHDLRNRWIKEACNPINLVLSQNTHQCSMHRLNCAWSLQTCMKCCSSVCNKAFSLWFPNGVGVFWSKPA